eukprot:scaffold11290_cov125-Isochrysis_galbana.AAC.2
MIFYLSRGTVLQPAAWGRPGRKAAIPYSTGGNDRIMWECDAYTCSPPLRDAPGLRPGIQQ